MKVSCVVLNFNLPKDTISVVTDLKKQTVKPEIIVVDNASTDDSIAQIKKVHPDIKLIVLDKNYGVAKGYNEGIKYSLQCNPELCGEASSSLISGSHYICVLNNDLIINQEDCIEQILKKFQDDKEGSVGVAGPLIYFAKGYEYHKEQKNTGKVIWYAGGKIDWNNVYHSHRGVDEVDKGQYSKTEETDFITGAFMVFKRKIFDKVGYFNEDYALYLEDAEICERVRRAGYKLLFVPQAKIYHKVSQTVGNSIGSGLNDYYLTRNRLLFGMQFTPLRTKLALLREAAKLLLTGRENQKRGAIDFFLCRFAKTL